MRQELLHICGPFSIQSYGATIAFGILVFAWLVQRDPQYKALNIGNKLLDILMMGIVVGILGGRLLYILSEPEADKTLINFLSFWEGGFSILGTIIGLVIVMPWFLRYLQVPIISLMDIAAIYVPLLQGISRVGCFLAGCCYGITTNVPWAIIYTHSNTVAPMNQYMHPTQLYSTLILCTIFLCMYYCIRKIKLYPGQLLMIYLMLSSAERFTVDFWRADRTIIETNTVLQALSINQLIAFAIFVTACIIYNIIPLFSSSKQSH